MIFWILSYWLFGFIGALLARWTLVHGTAEVVGIEPEPLTYGGLVTHCVTAWLGPVCWLAAALWALMWLSDKKHGFFARPVFAQARKP